MISEPLIYNNKDGAAHISQNEKRRKYSLFIPYVRVL